MVADTAMRSPDRYPQSPSSLRMSRCPVRPALGSPPCRTQPDRTRLQGPLSICAGESTRGTKRESDGGRHVHEVAELWRAPAAAVTLDEFLWSAVRFEPPLSLAPYVHTCAHPCMNPCICNMVMYNDITSSHPYLQGHEAGLMGP